MTKEVSTPNHGDETKAIIIDVKVPSKTPLAGKPPRDLKESIS